MGVWAGCAGAYLACPAAVGCGVDPGQHYEDRVRGLGLTGMHERMAMVGGTLSIASSADCGTTITARAPLRNEYPDHA